MKIYSIQASENVLLVTAKKARAVQKVQDFIGAPESEVRHLLLRAKRLGLMMVVFSNELGATVSIQIWEE